MTGSKSPVESIRQKIGRNGPTIVIEAEQDPVNIAEKIPPGSLVEDATV